MTIDKSDGLAIDAFDTVSASEVGAQMEIRSPDTGEVLRWNDGRPYTITFYGADAPQVKTVAQRQIDRRSQNMVRNRSAQLAAVTEKENIELLVSATKSWDMPLADRVTPAPNDANAYRQAYTKNPWLYEQGDQFVGLRSNFLKKTPQS